MTLAIQIYTYVVIAFILWLFHKPIRYLFQRIYYGFMNPIKEELPDFKHTPNVPDIELMDLVTEQGFPYDMKIKIISSESPFYWYEKISKIKDDAPNAEDKIFEVEYFDEKLYRTKIDTCGPGVKGFINVTDTESLGLIWPENKK